MNHTVAVAGTGSAAGPPDLVVVNAGVEVMARSVAEARAKAAADAQAVVAALRSHGVEPGDLTTTTLSIHPEYDHREGRRLRGYRVTNTIEARIGVVAGVGKLIDAVAAAGGDTTVVNGVNFTHKDPTDLEALARSAAWNDARRKAEQLAELAGLSLGPAIAISEGQTHAAPQPPMRAMALEAGMATPVEAGELAVTVTVNIEFSIAD